MPYHVGMVTRCLPVLLLLAACTAAPTTEPPSTPRPATPIAASPEPRSTVAPRPSPAPALLSVRREGGIAGLCDEVRVEPGDVAVHLRCAANGMLEQGRRPLSASESSVMRAAAARLRPFTFVRQDKARADGLSIAITFQGAGAEAATEAERAALIDFAQALLERPFSSDR